MSALIRLLKVAEKDIKESKSDACYKQRIKAIEGYWDKIAQFHISIVSADVSSTDYIH